MTPYKLVFAWKKSLIRIALLFLILIIGSVIFLLTQKDKIRLGIDAYLFGLPLVLMDITQTQTHANTPLNQLIYLREFPNEHAKTVVRPNLDTLYTVTFVDAEQGPWVLTVGTSPDRYNSVSILDAWTNVVAAPGTRNQGALSKSYLLVPSHWQGQAPEHMEVIHLPTQITWLIGRTQTNGTKDYPYVHQIQNRITLQSLQDWRQGVPPISHEKSPNTPLSVAPPIEQLHAMSTVDFFQKLSTLMVHNPPNKRDQILLTRMKSVGIQIGQTPELSLLDRFSFSLGRRIANWIVVHQIKHNQKGLVYGWSTPPDILGNYQDNYPIRAGVAMIGLGANLPVDTLYPSSSLDQTDQALNGDHRYRIHFRPNALPPVNAFWSLTAYDDNDFLIPNTHARYAIGDRDELHYNPDGSLDLYIQATPPTNQTSNWLPVAKGEDFLLMMRLYLPQDTALKREWTMPPIERLP